MRLRTATLKPPVQVMDFILSHLRTPFLQRFESVTTQMFARVPAVWLPLIEQSTGAAQFWPLTASWHLAPCLAGTWSLGHVGWTDTDCQPPGGQGLPWVWGEETGPFMDLRP